MVSTSEEYSLPASVIRHSGGPKTPSHLCFMTVEIQSDLGLTPPCDHVQAKGVHDVGHGVLFTCRVPHKEHVRQDAFIEPLRLVKGHLRGRSRGHDRLADLTSEVGDRIQYVVLRPVQVQHPLEFCVRHMAQRDM